MNGKESIDTMPAGREMNLALIELMGWLVSKDFRKDLGLDEWEKRSEWLAWLDDPSNYPYVLDVGNRLIVFRQPKQNGKTWSPWIDHNDAFELVDKMKELGFWWSSSYQSPLLIDHKWQAGYSVTFRCVQAGVRRNHTASALELPVAICRAARKVADSQPKLVISDIRRTG